MELIDWKTVLIAVVVGAAIVSVVWLIIPLGTALARRSQGVAREEPTVSPKPHPPAPDDDAEKEIQQVRDRAGKEVNHE